MSTNGTTTAEALDAGLAFTRTVDKTLVHRRAVGEVFVLDCVAVGDERALLAVQLPPAHAYYGDHDDAVRHQDPLLLVEACRQAAICGAHSVAGIGTDRYMIVDRFVLEVEDLDGLRAGSWPVDLVVDTAFLPQQVKGGRLRRGAVEQDLRRDGRRVARHRMDVVFLSGSEHEAFRRLHRTGEPPTTDTLGASAAPAPSRAPAGLVGRVHPANVVLGPPEHDGPASLRAPLRPRFDHPALFDHSYDHYPAMVLTEAARQAARAVSGVPGGAPWAVTAIRARFLRYAELDEPVVVHAADAGGSVAVGFTQGGDEAAAIEIDYLPRSAP